MISELYIFSNHHRIIYFPLWELRRRKLSYKNNPTQKLMLNLQDAEGFHQRHMLISSILFFYRIEMQIVTDERHLLVKEVKHDQHISIYILFIIIIYAYISVGLK